MGFKIVGKRGQLTVFIIVALLLLAALVLLYALYGDQITGGGDRTDRDPIVDFESCINSHVSEAVSLIFENSGYVELPVLTHKIENVKGYYRQEPIKEIPFLCFTPDNYAKCIPQTPLMISNLESQILEHIRPGVESCFNSLESDLTENAYEVRLGTNQKVSVELTERGISTKVIRELTQERSGKQESFEEFNALFRTPLYGVAKASERVVNEESIWCNSDYVDIMRANTDIEIMKFHTGDSIRIYTVTDLTTNLEWKFAVRGCVLDTPS
jgi:hypothetical protein